MDKVGASINAAFEKLRGDRRQAWDWRQAEAFRYTLPERGIPYINQTQSNVNAETDLEQARRLQGTIFDTTLLDSANTLARSLYQGATPPHSMWFDLTLSGVPLEQLTDVEKRYFDEVARMTHSKIHNGNYNSAAMEIFLDYVIGGMVAIYVELNDTNELFVECIPMFNIMVQETLKKGVVDTAYRLLAMPLTAAVSEFGLDNLPSEQQEQYRRYQRTGNEDYQKFEFIHCVRPRVGPNGRQVTYQVDPLKRIDNERWESIYISRGSGKVVRKGGFNEFPFIIPRWRCIPESPYGLGPVNDTLPDAKSLNKLVQQMFRANEVAISPPMKIKNDGVINPRTIRIGPRTLIKMQSMDSMEPLLTGTRYDISMGEINRMQGNIRRIMLAQELDPISKSNPTAYETDRYYEIMRQRLGPAYNVLHDQMIQPFVQRCFALLHRAGMLPTPPDRIQQYLDAGYLPCPEFKSPLARAGRIEDIQSIDRVVATLAGQRELYPNILDNFDSDKAIRFVADSLGVPASVIKTIDSVKKLRRDKAKIEQQVQAAAQAQAQIA